MPPAAGGGVGHDDRGAPAAQFGHVPVLPVDLLQIETRGRAHDPPVDDEVDGGLPGARRRRVRPAPDVQVDVVGIDGELRRGGRSRGGVGALARGRVVERVEHAGPALVDETLLTRGGPGQGRGAEGAAGDGPPAPGPVVEAGHEGSAAVVPGCGRVIGVAPSADEHVEVGGGEREGRRGGRAGGGVGALAGVRVVERVDQSGALLPGDRPLARGGPGGGSGAEGLARDAPFAPGARVEALQERALAAVVGGQRIGGEDGAVPVPHEVLGLTDLPRHRQRQDPLDASGVAVDGQREEVRALPYGGGVPRAAELGLEGPVDEVRRGVELNFMVGGDNGRHDPAVARRVPEDLRVAELLGPDVEHRGPVVEIGPGDALVRGVGQGLGLDSGGRVGAGPQGHDGGRLRGAQSGSVVLVVDRRAGEDAVGVRRRDGDGLLRPVDEVGGRGMAPGHVAPVQAVGVVLVEEVVGPVDVDEAVGVVDPVGLRSVVGLRAPGLAGGRVGGVRRTGLQGERVGQGEAEDDCEHDDETWSSHGISFDDWFERSDVGKGRTRRPYGSRNVLTRGGPRSSTALADAQRICLRSGRGRDYDRRGPGYCGRVDMHGPFRRPDGARGHRRHCGRPFEMSSTNRRRADRRARAQRARGPRGTDMTGGALLANPARAGMIQGAAI